MSNRWLNRITFWTLCVVPFVLVFLLRQRYGQTWFFFSFMVYIAIYRPVLAFFRLRQLGLIEKKNAWKLFIPFYGTQYTGDLWIG